MRLIVPRRAHPSGTVLQFGTVGARLRVLGRVAIVICVVASAHAAIQERGSLRVYVTTPDAQWDSRYPPLDSEATVSAFFEQLAVHHVARAYWRGSRADQVLQHYVIRREMPQRYDYWFDWLRHLYRDRSLNGVAVREAHRRGIQIFAMDGLFDLGGYGDAEGGQPLPNCCSDRLMFEHPDWSPVDRWGLRRQSGPLELVYPQAREALLQRFTSEVVDGGYDGLFLYTYFENFATRFEDEFGFNPPIVAEYSRRYGVDIRTQPFDRTQWGELRGEYVTKFLEQLHASLTARGKTLTIAMSPRNPDRIQDFPLSQGRINSSIRLDWRSWVRRGVVDEIAIMGGTDVEAIAFAERILGLGRSTVAVTILTESPGHPRFLSLTAQGVTLTGWSAPYRGPMERYSLAAPSAQGLSSSDWAERAQAAAAVVDGTLVAEPATLARLVADPHVLVRREAIRALQSLRAMNHKATIEAALNDPEESVRVVAMQALASIGNVTSAAAIRRALRAGSHFMVKEAAVNTLLSYGRAVVPELLQALQSPVAAERLVAIRALGRMILQEDFGTILGVARDDPDEFVRYYAIEALPRIGQMSYLLIAAKDPSPTIQMAAVRALELGVRSLSLAQAGDAMTILKQLFLQYGDRSTRGDHDWGWRVVARAMMTIGAESARTFLEECRQQRSDVRLAQVAYFALHVPQQAGQYVVSTREADEETYRRFGVPRE